MNNKFYWKYINIENYKEIQQELSQISIPILDTIPDVEGLYGLEKYKNIFSKTLFFKWIYSKNLIIRTFCFVITKPNHIQVVHTDYYKAQTYNTYSLNINILNCENNIVKMFDKKDNAKEIEIVSPNNYRYTFYYENDCSLATSYILNKPILLDVAIPHQVCNTTNNKRVSLSIRFHNDPMFLN